MEGSTEPSEPPTEESVSVLMLPCIVPPTRPPTECSQQLVALSPWLQGDTLSWNHQSIPHTREYLCGRGGWLLDNLCFDGFPAPVILDNRDNLYSVLQWFPSTVNVCYGNCFLLVYIQRTRANSFLHVFMLEALSVARAHVAALGGNALLSYRLSEVVFIEHPQKSQVR